jgi:oxidase EvaA
MNIPQRIEKISEQIASIYPGLSEQSTDILVSAATEYNPYTSTDDFFKWLKDLNDNVTFEINFVPLSKMASWGFDKAGNIRHASGKFFSIEGIKISAEFNGVVKEWEQPIISQPEVGFLGILCQKKQGVLYFLMQGKIEPGNVNKIQISPTLQATKSNFSQVHGGNTPKFLEYFKDDIPGRKIIVDQLQSEQGARFLRKRNRNMIIKIEEDLIVENIPDNFCWLTLGQIKKALTYPNLVNMDTRTVLSCIQII